jgi:hypothetical protein
MSMSKSLKDAVSRVSGKAPPPAEVQAVSVAPSRQGKKGVVTYLAPEAAKEIRQLALDIGSSIQELGVEAWNDLLQKHNRKPIA